MRNYCDRLTCSKETKKLIMNECIEEFKRNNKDALYRKVTQGEIIRRIAEYYLKH